MHLHAQIWGHVALATPATLAMELAEEACEMEMLRCRYLRMKPPVAVALGAFLPRSGTVIFNPNTLMDIASQY